MGATLLQILWNQEVKNMKSCTAPNLLFNDAKSSSQL